MTTREILIYLSLKYNGDFNGMYKAIQEKEEIDENATLPEMKCKAVTMIDEDYPDYLKECCMPPIVLYYYGDLSLIQDISKNLAVIGTRKPTPYGLFATERILNQTLDEDVVIVSGLARGIDVFAHELALKRNRRTIAVLGSGIDLCYPPKNKVIYDKIKEKGLIISEYPGETIPSPQSFPNRNRLIAALSKSVMVTEAQYRSGTSITVNYGLSMGKDILCVPRNIGENSLCNKLISQGAYLVESGKTVLDIMGIIKKEPIFEM